MNDDFTHLFKQMMAQSEEMLRAFQPMFEKMSAPNFTAPNFAGQGMDGFMPTMPKEMMEMWFGQTFNREGLDAKTRLLLVLGALTVLGAQAESQIKLTIRHALAAGATQREIAETIWQTGLFGGLPAMQKALEYAGAVFASTDGENT